MYLARIQKFVTFCPTLLEHFQPEFDPSLPLTLLCSAAEKFTVDSSRICYPFYTMLSPCCTVLHWHVKSYEYIQCFGGFGKNFIVQVISSVIKCSICIDCQQKISLHLRPELLSCKFLCTQPERNEGVSARAARELHNPAKLFKHK